jgi:hypothetical protein
MPHCWVFLKIFKVTPQIVSFVKEKVTLQQAMKAQTENRGIALIFL